MIKNISLQTPISQFWSSSNNGSRVENIYCTITSAFGWTGALLTISLIHPPLVMLPISCAVNILLEKTCCQFHSKCWQGHSNGCGIFWRRKKSIFNWISMINKRWYTLPIFIRTNDKAPSKFTIKQNWDLRSRKGMPSANPDLKKGKSDVLADCVI
jgi:hypothetical protein